MNPFDQLHPALQHHIVNSLGWRELRPFQEAAIAPLLAGQHQVILAPTAGGKTEAAFFPIMSRLLTSDWRGLSVLYICPIKALLNNLDVRLQRYTSLVGRRSALWHGDVGPSDRRRILRDPPDCLLTTPESLEALLVSPRIDRRRLFADVRVVIIDEIHAFAGDDRGWHLLSVLERITRFAGRELQRIGLSATVGNPERLLEWLAGSCTGPKGLLRPPDELSQPSRDREGAEFPETETAPLRSRLVAPLPDVQIDYVGTVSNAAVVISRLHRGEKRLVFVDSRAQAEELGAFLKQLDVTAFVTHSSLSQDQRRQAEEAFAQRDNCVIVATSVLELGIDVGDLDRVIQIDSPSTVASFLQRMGRTGRRADALRNCLFLTTDEPSLLQAAAIVDLWRQGYVEPVQPPALPFHVLAQQLMALTLQEKGIGRDLWLNWVRGVPAFAQMTSDSIREIVDWMLQKEILWSDDGMLAIAQQGEETFGRRHFMELLSVFTSPPLFTVLYGRRELGFVDELTFVGKQDGPRVLLLGGRAWRVKHIEWQSRLAYVEPSNDLGRSRWKGSGRGLSFRVAQAIKHVLAKPEDRPEWSQRARDQISQIRSKFEWLTPLGSIVIKEGDSQFKWWTFAGQGTNASLVPTLAGLMQATVDYDDLAINFESDVPIERIGDALRELRTRSAVDLLPSVEETAISGIKFSECLPPALATRMLQSRLQDISGIEHVIRDEVEFVASR
ncbi:MAG: DEAD/DEAH box helicase [Planctomycetaceae bacterium]